MNNVKAQLTFEQAKALAQQEAVKRFTRFLADPSTPLLDDFFLEEAGSWNFFRNRKIIIPPEFSLTGDWSYVVSRRGEIRLFYDLRDDLDKAKKAHKVVSDYFLANDL
jgi:hypothetical protein